MEITHINEMMGMVFDEVVVTDDTLIFKTSNGEYAKFYHEQDCCESVYIEDISGDVDDLIGVPIVIAQEINNHPYEEQWGGQIIKGEYGYDEHPEIGHFESYTWTFYKFATIKGYVDVRWFGSSNGYYSEGVNFKTNLVKLENPEGY